MKCHLSGLTFLKKSKDLVTGVCVQIRQQWTATESWLLLLGGFSGSLPLLFQSLTGRLHVTSVYHHALFLRDGSYFSGKAESIVS